MTTLLKKGRILMAALFAASLGLAACDDADDQGQMGQQQGQMGQEQGQLGQQQQGGGY